MSSRTARRGTRPWILAGGGIGSPMTATTRRGRGTLAPTGRALTVPPSPTGTIGTPARAATNAGPSSMSSRLTRSPERRVPSGNITSGSPRASTSVAARSAVRSAVPRCTGKPPMADRKAPRSRISQRLSFPMNRRRRLVIIPAIGVSMNDR